MALQISTPAFSDGGIIPARYACFGDNVQPKLRFANAPERTASFALVFHDIDVALDGRPEDGLHWILWNVPVTAGGLPEGGVPAGTVVGRNVEGRSAYLGPGAPYSPRYHHYVFDLFALDSPLDLPPAASRPELLAAIDGRILAKAAYVGRFRRRKNARRFDAAE